MDAVARVFYLCRHAHPSPFGWVTIGHVHAISSRPQFVTAFFVVTGITRPAEMEVRLVRDPQGGETAYDTLPVSEVIRHDPGNNLDETGVECATPLALPPLRPGWYTVALILDRAEVASCSVRVYESDDDVHET